MLVHHPDPRGHRVARACKTNFLFIQEDATSVRLVETVQQVHQCRFSRAIFAQKRVDFSRLHHERDVVVSDNGTKLLGHSLQFKLHRLVLLFKTGRAEENGGPRTVSGTPITSL